MTEEEKQIEEIAKSISKIQYLGGLEMKIAEGLYKEGCRKRKHGRWNAERTVQRCTNCGAGLRDARGIITARSYDYCPKCGAIMDERKKI